MAVVHLTKADQGRLDSLKEAFHQVAETEWKKGLGERLRDAVALPFYFHKGAAEGALKLLESGQEPLIQSLSEGYQLVKNPRGFWAQKEKAQEDLKTTLKSAIQNPRKFLRQILEGIKDKALQKTLNFLKSSRADQAESLGKIAPDIALGILGGEALKAESFFNGFSKINSPRRYPFGFKSFKAFEKFGSMMKEGLEEIGVSDAKVFLRGSSVTGTSFRNGLAFDMGRTSDFDVAVSSPSLFEKAKDIGVKLRSRRTRTAPLEEFHLKKLRIRDLVDKLNKDFGREISFMIYDSPESIFSRGPNIKVP